MSRTKRKKQIKSIILAGYRKDSLLGRYHAKKYKKKGYSIGWI